MIREPGPWNRFASNAPSHQPLAAQSSSSHFHRTSPNSRRAPPGLSPAQNDIRCSDCGVWVALLSLGEHRCAGVPIQASRKPDMKVDTGLRVGAGGPQPFPKGYSDSDFLPPRSASLESPLALVGAPLASPSDVTYISTSSSTKLPFFERYHKLVGTVTTGLNDTMARSKSTLDDLAKLTIGEPVTTTPAPTFASRTTPSPPQIVHHRQESSTELLYTRSSASTNSSQESHYPNDYFSRQLTQTPTPTSSVPSNSPRSRKASLVTPTPDRPTFVRNASDSAVTEMKGSKSTPADLASYGQLRSPISPTSSWKGLSIDLPTSRSGKGLDDILNDLNFMMTDEAPLSPQFSLDDRPIQKTRLPPSHSSPALSSKSSICATCRAPIFDAGTKRGADGKLVCVGCSRVVECRKCKKAIKGGSVTSEKIVGKYHPECFSCSNCSTKLNSEFYVFDSQPFCQQHYHELNGSLCTNRRCAGPIEGPCVSLVGKANGDGGRYHPECFKCANKNCQIPLLDFHFVINRLPYCERHADSPPRSFLPSNPTPASRLPPNTNDGGRAKKRQTLISRR